MTMMIAANMIPTQPLGSSLNSWLGSRSLVLRARTSVLSEQPGQAPRASAC
jgi:hypothetical protein